jgi:hypothetical protein
VPSTPLGFRRAPPRRALARDEREVVETLLTNPANCSLFEAGRRELLPRDAEGVPNAHVTAPYQPREAFVV